MSAVIFTVLKCLDKESLYSGLTFIFVNSEVIQLNKGSFLVISSETFFLLGVFIALPERLR